MAEYLAAHHALRCPDPEEISKLEQDSFKTGRLKRGSVVSQSSHVTAAFRLRARYWFGWRSGVPLRPFGRGISDRKSTRLNSSHVSLSYAVFCLRTYIEKT